MALAGAEVSKEQIIALLTALDLFSSGAYDRQLTNMRHWLEQIARGLEGLSAGCRIIDTGRRRVAALLEISVHEQTLGRSAFEVCRRLSPG